MLSEKFEEIMINNEDLEVFVNTQDLREVLVDYIKTKRELKVVSEKNKYLSGIIRTVSTPKHSFVDIKGVLADYIC